MKPEITGIWVVVDFGGVVVEVEGELVVAWRC